MQLNNGGNSRLRKAKFIASVCGVMCKIQNYETYSLLKLLNGSTVLAISLWFSKLNIDDSILQS